MAIVLGRHLAPIISDRCVHVAGHGGAKKAVRDVVESLTHDCHVMKSDVRGYYASIDHRLLFGRLSEYVPDRHLLHLLWQYLKRKVCYGNIYRDVTRGISLGCPLSPLMAALFMKPLDDAMQKAGLFYVRFMDDWLVIAPTRWKLRKAVRVVNEVLESLLLEKHPDKTFIGRADHGFSFLGYQLSPSGISVAKATVIKMQEHIARLYEQGAGEIGIGQYIRQWVGWVFGGIIDFVPS